MVIVEMGSRVFDTVIAVSLSLLGGIVNVILREPQVKVIDIIKGMVVAGFAGMIVYLLIYDVTWMSPAFKGAITGLAGFSGEKVLYCLRRIFLKRIKGK